MGGSYGRYMARGGGSPAPFENVYSVNIRAAGGQYINFGNHSQLAFAYNSPFSLSIWFKTTNLTQNYTNIMGKILPSPYQGYELTLKNQTLDFALAASISNYIEVQTNNFISSGVWYHACLTYSGNGLASGFKMYINGSLVTLNNVHDNLGGGDTTYSAAFAFAARGNNSDNMTGGLDEGAVFNVALSQSDVTEIYNGGSPGDLSKIAAASSIQLWSRLGDGDNINANGFKDHSANAFLGSANTVNWFPSDIVADVP